MSDRYDYTSISEEAKQYAIKELNENPSQVNAHIESLRKWVKSMPHLTCPTDADFLLKFLRVAKFDHAKAQMRLDNFCTLRSTLRMSSKFLKQFKLDDPIMEKFLNMKFSIPLGRSESGEMIFLFRFHTWDPALLSWSDVLSLFYMDWNILVMDEITQIYGIKMIFDMENMSRKAIEAMSDPRDVKAGYKIFQDSFPMRVKSQIFYKEPVIFEIVFKIILVFLSEKLKSRTFRLSQNLEKAEKQIPGLLKILPKEYKGQGDTIDNISERWIKRFKDFYEKDNLFSKLSVDESKRPPETSKYLADFLEYKDETLGKVGTFTKFENTF